jgi:prepilin-type processing-associated H-X9-DG protein
MLASMEPDDPKPSLPLEYRRPGIEQRKSHWRFWWVYALALVFVGLGVSVLLPSDWPGSKSVPRVKCASNLHQLGLAMIMYMQDNNGQYPPSLATLLVDEQITAQVFICPDSADTPATGATTQAIAADLLKPGHCSYIYLGNGLTDKTTPANAVIAYEPLSNHAAAGWKGMNVLYGDGHIDWDDAQTAAKILAKIAATSRPVTFP